MPSNVLPRTHRDRRPRARAAAARAVLRDGRRRRRAARARRAPCLLRAGRDDPRAGRTRPDSCYVIKQGAVRGERPGAAGDAAGLWELSAGEMFPLGALLGRPRRDVGLPRGAGHVLPRVSRGGVRRAGRAVGAVPRLLHASARLPPRRAARRRAGGVRRRPDDAAGHELAAVRPPALGARDGRAGCGPRGGAADDGGPPDRFAARRRRAGAARRDLHAAGRHRTHRASEAQPRVERSAT